MYPARMLPADSQTWHGRATITVRNLHCAHNPTGQSECLSRWSTCDENDSTFQELLSALTLVVDKLLFDASDMGLGSKLVQLWQYMRFPYIDMVN